MELTGTNWRLLIGDAKSSLADLPDCSVHCCVTSPPYWGLRDYGVDGQLGLEETPNQFIANMVGVFREVRRVLRDDGCLWLNMGDSYNAGRNGGHPGGAASGFQQVDERYLKRSGANAPGLKPKDLVGIPWMLAFALRADGWYLRSDCIWCLSGGATVYARTQKGEMPMTIKDLVRLDPATVKLWNGEKWTQCLGWNESPRPENPLEIELRSGEKIGCTPGHVWPTQRGNVRTDELQVGDVIDSTTLPEPREKYEPGHIDGQVAWLLGLFLAEGSFDSRGRIQIAGHAKENASRSGRLIGIAEQWGGTVNPYESGNSGCVVVNCPPLTAIIRQYINGSSAKTKHLKTRAWRHANQWLRNLLDGYLEGDGTRDEQNNRWKIRFTRNDQLAQDFRTICARLGCALTLKTGYSEAWGRSWPVYSGELRFERSGHHNEKERSEIVSIGRSRARRFYDIGVEDEPHLFALSSGVLTHNSKPNPMPESVQDRPSKSHEYVFLLSKSERYFYDGQAVREEGKGYGRSERFRDDKYTNGRSFDNDGNYGATQGGGKALKDGSGRNLRTVWTIPTQPYSAAHFACVDDQTEALTPTGWKKHSELSGEETIAIYCPKTDSIRWGLSTIHRYQCDEPLVAIDKRDTSQFLTENHRCLIRHRSGRIDTVEAKDLCASHQLMMAAPWGGKADNSVGLDMASLVGWYVAEGHRRGRQVWITQSQTANPQHVDEIRRILTRLEASFSEKTRERTWRGRESNCVEFCIRGSVAMALQSLCPRKELTPYLASLNKNEAQALLDALIDADGNRREDGRCCIIQKSKRHIDVMQMLALRLGYRAHISERKTGGFALYLTTGRWLTLRGTNGSHGEIPRVPYSGIVWCPNTETGYWLARRKGKPFITGNTFPEKLAATCILAGTSERGCCPECGTPWRRVVDRQDSGIPISGNKEKKWGTNHTVSRKDGKGEVERQSSIPLNAINYKTVGWEPGCGCDAGEPVPCTVLDQFCGSGTTGKVAVELGRRFVGCELNPEYAELARERIENRKRHAANGQKAIVPAEGQQSLFGD